MRAGTDTLEAVILLRGTAPEDDMAATEHIVAVDPSSKGVPMRQLRRIQLDVSAAGLSVYFGGNSRVRTAVTTPCCVSSCA